jgi:hypothetical protein
MKDLRLEKSPGHGKGYESVNRRNADAEDFQTGPTAAALAREPAPAAPKQRPVYLCAMHGETMFPLFIDGLPHCPDLRCDERVRLIRGEPEKPPAPRRVQTNGSEVGAAWKPRTVSQAVRRFVEGAKGHVRTRDIVDVAAALFPDLSRLSIYARVAATLTRMRKRGEVVHVSSGTFARTGAA